MAVNSHQYESMNSHSFRPISSTSIDEIDLPPLSAYRLATESDSTRTNTAITVNEMDPPDSNRYITLNHPNNTMGASLRAVARKYEIQMRTAERLMILRDFEIVIVVDDSGSMMTTVDGTRCTRWDELCSILKIVMEIGIIFDLNGIDIHFINGRRLSNVKDSTVVERAFETRPSGYTPLVPVLDNIFQSPLSHRGRDKKLLIFVATDGVPTDNDGNENISELERIMREKRQVDTTYVSFLLCTDDPSCVAYLNEWDRTMAHVDVTDDFYTEREKIRRHRGINYPFSLDDYVVKALIGAVDHDIDILNEPA